jgi:hypothetical protein
VTNSASLTVNENVAVSVVPVNSTNCPGTATTFTIVASGTGLAYQWYKDGTALSGQTGSSLNLTNITAANAGTYSVVAKGVCGNAATNSASLAVNTNVNATPLANLQRNPGQTAVFSTITSGTGPIICVWKKNGGVIAGQTATTLILSNVTYADAGTYTVEVSGACDMMARSATLAIDMPPTVNITTPTNGAVFVFPQGVPILAQASDPDGTVSLVELFQGSTKLSEAGAPPYYYFWTNVPVGAYQLSARATDNSGLTATSSVVNITVIDHAPLAAGPITLNRQTGLFEQAVTITNPTLYTFTGVRILIENLTAETKVVNATGTNNGIPYIDYTNAIASGLTGALLIQYFVPSRTPPVPTLVPQLLGTDYGAAKLAPPPPIIDNCARLANGGMMLQFFASANYTYYIQYCSSLGGPWKTAAGTITGTGALVTWTDTGMPVTDSNPSTQVSRLYRVIVKAP